MNGGYGPYGLNKQPLPTETDFTLDLKPDPKDPPTPPGFVSHLNVAQAPGKVTSTQTSKVM